MSSSLKVKTAPWIIKIQRKFLHFTEDIYLLQYHQFVVGIMVQICLLYLFFYVIRIFCGPSQMHGGNFFNIDHLHVFSYPWIATFNNNVNFLLLICIFLCFYTYIKDGSGGGESATTTTQLPCGTHELWDKTLLIF